MGLDVHLVHGGITYGGFGISGQPGEPSLIHHGLALIGSATRAAGHSVTLTDLRACAGWDDFRQRIGRTQPAVFGFTMMSCEFDEIMEAVRLAKKHHPQAIMILGGAHPTLMPHEIEACPEVDVVFQGEGEITFPQLLTQVERGEQLPRQVRGDPPDLDKLPFAARDLFPAQDLPWPSLGFRQPFVTIITGRGCRYNCSFCQPAERLMFGKRVRRRSVANVMEELRSLREKQGLNSLMIHDDCLTEDPGWVQEFCAQYTASGFNAPFLCQSRPDLICKHPDLIAEMRRAGLRWLIIGFESGSDRVLRFLRKGTTCEQNLEAARLCRRLGIRIWANYMLGLPTETRDEVRETVAMISKIRPDIGSPAYYTPHPGSDLFAYCQEHGLSLIESHRSYMRYPDEPKIRGVDYDFLKGRVEETLDACRYGPVDRLARIARRLGIPEPVRRLVKRAIAH